MRLHAGAGAEASESAEAMLLNLEEVFGADLLGALGQGMAPGKTAGFPTAKAFLAKLKAFNPCDEDLGSAGSWPGAWHAVGYTFLSCDDSGAGRVRHLLAGV